MFDLAALGPGYADHPVDITAQNRRLRGHGRHHFELVQFGQRLLPGFVRHLGVVNPSLQFIQFIGGVIQFPQFLLNGLHLLVEVVLALTLLHLLFDATANALFNLEQIDFRIHQAQQVIQALTQGRNLQNALLLLQINAHVGRYGVCQTTWIINT